MIDRAKQAADFILSHCPNVGAFHGTGDPYGFLQETAKDMRGAKPTTIFPDRYIEHVAYAVDTVGSSWFTSPPAAVAAVYLVTRFEFYFRLLSGSLNGDGTWVSQSAQRVAIATLNDSRLKRGRISDISLAYRIMGIGTAKIIPYLASLDNSLYTSPTEASGNFRIEHLGDRIAYGRHGVGHGHRGDISAEAVFYGLMTAIVFYAH